MNITCQQKLNSPIEITGDGCSSLWADRWDDTSAGTFHVDNIELRFHGFDNPDDPLEGAWTLNYCYGKDFYTGGTTPMKTD